MFNFKKDVKHELNELYAKSYTNRDLIDKTKKNIQIIKSYLLKRNTEYKKEITGLKTKIQKQNEIIRLQSAALQSMKIKIELIMKEVGLEDNED